jgi:hypothetical protein
MAGPGNSLRFAALTVETAEALCRDVKSRLTQMAAWLEPIPDRPTLDPGPLDDGNLISGVVSGLDQRLTQSPYMALSLAAKDSF